MGDEEYHQSSTTHNECYSLIEYLPLSPSRPMMMIYELPLFPLNTVLFPGVPIQLHIFESRYKLLVRYCLEKNEPFGIALIRKGIEALGPLAEPYSIGCTARIVEIEPVDNGNMNLTALGDERFEIKELDRSMPYLIGKVEAKPLVSEQALEQLPGTKLLEDWMKDYLSVLAAIGETTLDLNALEFPDEPVPLMYFGASLLQLPAIEKQPLLSAVSSVELIKEIIRLYRRETTILEQLKAVQEDNAARMAWLN